MKKRDAEQTIQNMTLLIPTLTSDKTKVSGIFSQRQEQESKVVFFGGKKNKKKIVKSILSGLSDLGDWR